MNTIATLLILLLFTAATDPDVTTTSVNNPGLNTINLILGLLVPLIANWWTRKDKENGARWILVSGWTILVFGTLDSALARYADLTHDIAHYLPTALASFAYLVIFTLFSTIGLLANGKIYWLTPLFVKEYIKRETSLYKAKLDMETTALKTRIGMVEHSSYQELLRIKESTRKLRSEQSEVTLAQLGRAFDALVRLETLTDDDLVRDQTTVAVAQVSIAMATLVEWRRVGEQILDEGLAYMGKELRE